ncbi:MAG: hypothetical protein EXS16_10695 [Gemmataceae bacterium]|nr:hypothetical protein [Gemmataceae bacterium]
MKGFIRQTGVVVAFGSLLFASVGCYHYRELVDPCWPERYNSMARQSVRDIHNAQAEKGHVLDQTIWNYHFEVDPKTDGPTDRLNAMGIEHLKYLSRKLPVPDPQLYLQHAQDISYASNVAPGKLVDSRNQLNTRRSQAVEHFLATQTVGRSTSYQIAVHDFAPPSYPPNWTHGSVDVIKKDIDAGKLRDFTLPSISNK